MKKSISIFAVGLVILLVLAVLFGIGLPLWWGTNKTAISTAVATWFGGIGAIVVTGLGAYAAWWVVDKQNQLIESQAIEQNRLIERQNELIALQSKEQNTLIERQNSLIERQTQVDLFDKRYEVIEPIWAIIDAFAHNDSAERKDYIKFNSLRLKTEFLFRKEICELLLGIRSCSENVDKHRESVKELNNRYDTKRSRLAEVAGAPPLSEVDQQAYNAEFSTLNKDGKELQYKMNALYDEFKIKMKKVMDVSDL